MHDLFSLEGKTAIVTGATGGLGSACTQALLQHGAGVIAVGRNTRKLRTLSENLNDPGNMLQIAKLDMSSMSHLQSFFAQHEADILVNSVGVNIPKSMLDIGEEEYDEVMHVNMKTTFFQTKYFVEKKRSTNKPASIIHISSQMGLVGGDERSVYCASKHAVNGFCKAAALELGQWNIRINAICPTFVETELTRSTLDDPKKRERIIQSIALKRLGSAEDLYGAVIYLASDASSLVTGSALLVDGGWTAQ